MMVWWWAAMAGRLVLVLQTMEWEIREQQGWQRPCNETPLSPHWTWVVRSHGGREKQKRIEAREQMEFKGKGAMGSKRLID